MPIRAYENQPILWNRYTGQFFIWRVKLTFWLIKFLATEDSSSARIMRLACAHLYTEDALPEKPSMLL
jgi:hypothetical protein